MAFSKAPLERMPFLKADPIIPGPGAYEIPSPEKEASAISIKGITQVEKKVHEQPARKGKENKRQKAGIDALHSPLRPVLNAELESQRARDLAHLKMEAISTKKEIEGLTKSKTALEREVECKNKEVEKAVHKLSALETKLRDMELEKKTLSSERHILEREGKDLALRLRDTQQELEKTKAKKENKEWQAKYEATSVQLATAKITLTKTENDLAARVSLIHELESRLLSDAAALVAAEAKFSAEAAEMVAKQAVSENALAQREASLSTTKQILSNSEATKQKVEKEIDRRLYHEQRTAWHRSDEETKQRHSQESAEASEKISQLEADWRLEKAQWLQQDTQLKTLIASLQTEAATLQASLGKEQSERKHENEASEKTLAELRSMILTTEARISAAEREIALLQSEIAAQESQKATLEAELKVKNELIREQSAQLTSVLATVRVMEEALATAQTMGVLMRDQLKEKEQTLVSVMAAKKEIEGKASREIHMLNACILEYTSKVTSLTMKLGNVEQQMKTETEAKDQLSTLLNEKTVECTAVMQEGDNRQKRMQNEIQLLSANLAKETDAFTELKSRFQQLSATESDLRSNYLALRNKYELTERIYDEDREKLSGEVGKWREEVAKECIVKVKIEDERDRLQEQLISLTSDLASRVTQLSLLESTFASYKEQADAREAELSEKIIVAQKEKAEVDSRAKAVENSTSDLGTRFVALQESRQELLDKVGNINEALKRREQQLAEQRIEYSRAATLAQGEILNLTEHLRKAVEERRQTVQALEMTKVALETSKAEKEREHQRAERNKELAEKSVTLDKQLYTQQAEVATVQRRVVQERDCAIQYAEQCRQEHGELQMRANNLTRENQIMTNEVARLKQYLQSAYEAQGEVDKLQLVNRELAAMHDMSSRGIEELTKQNAALVGHSNHKQKIQMHLKVKEENNQLRLEMARVMEVMKARDDYIKKLEGEVARAESGRTKAALTMTPAPARKR